MMPSFSICSNCSFAYVSLCGASRLGWECAGGPFVLMWCFVWWSPESVALNDCVLSTN